VVRQLRHLIILGHLEPGERLIETRLAQQLGVARGTVREALRRLEAESLIESVSHRGSRVAQLDLADVFDLCEVRSLLEAQAMHRLRLPLDAEIRDHLQHIVGEMRKLHFPDDADQFIDLDDAFHRGLVAASGQRRLFQAWNSVSSLLSTIVAISLRYITIDSEVTAERHEAIIDALGQTDPDIASEVVADHYRSLVANLARIAESPRLDAAGDA
jgi:DNA-binding GntR family transcriptional regulator